MEEVDLLVFGRVTYELMVAYWPTQAARENDPEVAAKMNGLPKVAVRHPPDGGGRPPRVRTRHLRADGGVLADPGRAGERPGGRGEDERPAQGRGSPSTRWRRSTSSCSDASLTS